MKSSNDVNKTALLPLARYICACAKMTSDMYAVGITILKCPQVKSSQMRDRSLFKCNGGGGWLKSGGGGDIKFHVNCRGVTINFGLVKIATIKSLKFSSLGWFLKNQPFIFRPLKFIIFIFASVKEIVLLWSLIVTTFIILILIEN